MVASDFALYGIGAGARRIPWLTRLAVDDRVPSPSCSSAICSGSSRSAALFPVPCSSPSSHAAGRACRSAVSRWRLCWYPRSTCRSCSASWCSSATRSMIASDCGPGRSCFACWWRSGFSAGRSSVFSSHPRPPPMGSGPCRPRPRLQLSSPSASSRACSGAARDQLIGFGRHAAHLADRCQSGPSDGLRRIRRLCSTSPHPNPDGSRTSWSCGAAGSRTLCTDLERARQPRARPASLPLIAKPDFGGTARRIDDVPALREYLRQFPAGESSCCSAWRHMRKATVLYARMPGAPSGRILSLARTPVPRRHITPPARARLDAIARSMREFHYGRFELRFARPTCSRRAKASHRRDPRHRGRAGWCK